ncbi:hypothetical protein AgCh_020560 [Apium graveolens]
MANKKLRKKVGEMEVERGVEDMRIFELEQALKDMTMSRDDEKEKRERAEAELASVIASNKTLIEDNSQIKYSMWYISVCKDRQNPIPNTLIFPGNPQDTERIEYKVTG